MDLVVYGIIHFLNIIVFIVLIIIDIVQAAQYTDSLKNNTLIDTEDNHWLHLLVQFISSTVSLISNKQLQKGS